MTPRAAGCRRMAAILVALSSAAAHADEIDTFADLKATGAQSLTVEELNDVLPDASVISVLPVGNTRRWKNEKSGQFVASNDGRVPQGVPFQGIGSWRIGDEATYCVKIEWRHWSENWCAQLFKLQDVYYTARVNASATSKVYPLRIQR